MSKPANKSKVDGSRRRKTGGRVAGTPNKITASVKAALQEAFEARGGIPALLQWADDEPSEFYKLWGRMLPLDVQHSGSIDIAAELAKRVARV